MDRISQVVAEILQVGGHIAVDEASLANGMVNAYSWSHPAGIRKHWELAIKVACMLDPELVDANAHDCDWSMNLFTVDGLWVFPEESMVF